MKTMGVQRKILFVALWMLVSLNSCYCIDKEDEEPPSEHENLPRMLVNMFSRPGDKTTEKQEDASFWSHLMNVLKGGSIGFEVETRPMEKVNTIADKVKELFPVHKFFNKWSRRSDESVEPGNPAALGFDGPKARALDENGEDVIQPRGHNK